MNQRRLGVVLSYMTMALGALVSLTVTPFILTRLGVNEFGVFNLASSMISLLYLFGFGFSAAYMRFYWIEYRAAGVEGVRQLNAVFLLMFLCSSALSTLTGILFLANIGSVMGATITPGEANLTRTLGSMMLLSAALSFPLSLFDSYVLVHERFVFQRSVSFVRQVVGPLLYVPVLLLGFRSEGLVAVSVILYVLTGIATIWYCASKLDFGITLRGLDLYTARSVVIFSSYLFLNLVVDQINWNADRLILGRFSGSESVAVYSLAAQLNQMFILFSTAISSAFAPVVNSLATRNDSHEDVGRIFIRVGRVQFSVLSIFLVGFCVLGHSFVELWVGAQFLDVYFVTLLLIGPVTVALIQNVGLEIQKARNLHRFRSKILLVGAVINVVASMAVAGPLGPIGVAGVTGAALLIFNGFLMNWYYARRLEIPIRLFWSSILSLSRAPFAAFVAGILVVSALDEVNLYEFIVSASVMLGVHCAILWRFCMTSEEKLVLRWLFTWGGGH